MPLLAMLLAAAPLPAAASAQAACTVCSEADRPLRITIEADLVFPRLAPRDRAGGEVLLAPGDIAARPTGDLVVLGGEAMAGRVLVTGTPMRGISVRLPDRVTLHGTDGGTMELTGLVTDLGPAPRLDAHGQLRFAFGGRIIVTGPVSGRLRGRIPIDVDYD